MGRRKVCVGEFQVNAFLMKKSACGGRTGGDISAVNSKVLSRRCCRTLTTWSSTSMLTASGVGLCGSHCSLTLFMGQSRRDGSSGILGGGHITSVGLYSYQVGLKLTSMGRHVEVG